ncbi:hypothetical protein QN348_20865, partial [Mucilaginibacter sp. 5C4]
DKATYSFHITVPAGKAAVANGLAAGPPRTKAGWTTWSSQATDPMSSYLSTATVGDFTLATHTGPRGLPIVSGP